VNDTGRGNLGSLSDEIGKWGEYPLDHPQTLAELMDADPKTIQHPLARALRAMAVDLTNRSEKHYITGPWSVLELIAKGYVIHPWSDAWVCYALSGERQPILVPKKPKKGEASSTAQEYLRKATRLIPHAEDLPTLPHERGKRESAWLIVYGGTPEVLSKPGVAKGLTTLARKLPISDVVFYHSDTETGTQPTLWSVRAGCGMSGASRHSAIEVPFPDPEKAAEIRSNL
jgi:hypothetical protein